jgi:hypothetical protein
MDNEVTAKHHTVGNATAWFAHRGYKVLCDRQIRARRFQSEAAALKAGQKATPEQFF